MSHHHELKQVDYKHMTFIFSLCMHNKQVIFIFENNVNQCYVTRCLFLFQGASLMFCQNEGWCLEFLNNPSLGGKSNMHLRAWTRT